MYDATIQYDIRLLAVPIMDGNGGRRGINAKNSSAAPPPRLQARCHPHPAVAGRPGQHYTVPVYTGCDTGVNGL